jgi:hypothetical protein
LDTIQKIYTEKMKAEWRIENLSPIDYYHLFNIAEPPDTTKEMYVQRRINIIKEARVKKGEPKSTTEEKEEWKKYYYEPEKLDEIKLNAAIIQPIEAKLIAANEDVIDCESKLTHKTNIVLTPSKQIMLKKVG